MRVLVCTELVFFTELIHGAASGADQMAGYWAANTLPSGCIKVFLANWKRFGRDAGPIRNQKNA